MRTCTEALVPQPDSTGPQRREEASSSGEGWPGPAPGAARPAAPRPTLAILGLSQVSSLTAVCVRGGGPDSPRSRAQKHVWPHRAAGSCRATRGAPWPALGAREAGARTGVRHLPHRPVLDLNLESGDPPPLLVCPSLCSPMASSPGSLPRQHAQAAAGQGQATCPKDPGPEPVAGEPAPAGQPGGAGTSSQPSALGMPASAGNDSAGGRGTGVCT